MIREVKGTRPWGCSRKRVPKCLKGPITIYTTFAIAKNSPREVKRAHLVYIGSPKSHPGNEIDGARRGRSLPVSHGFSSHAQKWPDPCQRYTKNPRYTYIHVVGWCIRWCTSNLKPWWHTKSWNFKYLSLQLWPWHACQVCQRLDHLS